MADEVRVSAVGAQVLVQGEHVRVPAVGVQVLTQGTHVRVPAMGAQVLMYTPPVAPNGTVALNVAGTATDHPVYVNVGGVATLGSTSAST